MEAAERAGAMITEQIRAITETAEHRAGELRHEAEADAESLAKESRDAARGILERIDRLEAAVRQLIGSMRHEADTLSRLVDRGHSRRSNRPSRSAPPVEPLALHPGSAPADASPTESPEPEIAVSSADAVEAEGTEHPPTVDDAEPALEDEPLGDVEAAEAEPYSGVEVEPPLDVEHLETPEPLLEAHQPDESEPLPLDEAEIAPPVPEEPEGIDESREDESAGREATSPGAAAPEPEIAVGSADAVEAEGLEHPPTVDHAEPALEDEPLGDVEAAEAEPYSEVEVEPPLDVEHLETPEPLLEAHQPDESEPLPLDEAEIAPPVPEEPEGIDESREDQSAGREATSPGAAAPEPEIAVSSADAVEAEGMEHPPTVDDHAEPALEDEPLGDVEAAEAEPYSEVEEPLAGERYPEAGQSPLETQPPEVRESPLEDQQVPDSELVPPLEEGLVESEPTEESELGSTEDPRELKDDVEVDSRDAAAPSEEASASGDTSAGPEKHRRRGLRAVFGRWFPLSEPSEDEQASGDLPRSEETLEAEEGSAEDRLPSESIGSGIEEPPRAGDELLVSPPLVVVQQGWWEQEPSEDETPTGEPPADAETDVGEGMDAAREDSTSHSVVSPHEDALDAAHEGGEPLEEPVEREGEALSDASQGEREADVDVSPGGIRPTGPDASVETPRCVACGRVHEGSVEVAEAEGWHVAGAEALCERCRAAGWRLQEESQQPRRRVWGSRFS